MAAIEVGEFATAGGAAGTIVLVAHIDQAGVSVGVSVRGEPRPLSPGADLSAYRIVQEALTNVVRHAAPATAELTLSSRLRRQAGRGLKDTTPEKLLDAIRVVASGEALLAPTVIRRLIAAFTARAEPAFVTPAVLETLTDREREILREVARGLSNTEIAERLHMSGATAKTHVSRLLMKRHGAPGRERQLLRAQKFR